MNKFNEALENLTGVDASGLSAEVKGYDAIFRGENVEMFRDVEGGLLIVEKSIYTIKLEEME